MVQRFQENPPVALVNRAPRQGKRHLYLRLALDPEKDGRVSAMRQVHSGRLRTHKQRVTGSRAVRGVWSASAILYIGPKPARRIESGIHDELDRLWRSMGVFVVPTVNSKKHVVHCIPLIGPSCRITRIEARIFQADTVPTYSGCYAGNGWIVQQYLQVTEDNLVSVRDRNCPGSRVSGRVRGTHNAYSLAVDVVDCHSCIHSLGHARRQEPGDLGQTSSERCQQTKNQGASSASHKFSFSRSTFLHFPKCKNPVMLDRWLIGGRITSGFSRSQTERRNAGANRLIRIENNFLTSQARPPLAESRVRNCLKHIARFSHNRAIG